MKNRVIKSWFTGGFIVLLMAVLTGCETCKPGQLGEVQNYSVEVSLDPSLKASSVLVDLVGVNPSNLPRWEGYDMGKYWKEGDGMRRDADKMVLNFVSGQALAMSLPPTDPQWAKWNAKGVTHLLVLADLPGAHTPQPGNQDPRRQILSRCKCAWPNGTKSLNVLVQRSGIAVLTPARAAK